MYQLENFIQLLLLFLFRTAFYSFGYAVLKMLFQDLLFYLGKGAFDGIYLVQNINTILTIFDHPLNAANLPLNSPQGD